MAFTHTLHLLFQDKGAPAAINTRFQGADFEARFIEQDPKSKVLAKMAGLDGFSFSAKPLFKVYCISGSVSFETIRLLSLELIRNPLWID